MTEKTEVVGAEGAAIEVAPNALDLGNWNLPKIQSRDIYIPRIFVMQGQSPLVGLGKAIVGELRSFPDGLLVGGIDDPLELVPVYYNHFFREFHLLPQESTTEKRERRFIRKIPLTDETSNLEWREELPDGITLQRDRCMDLFCLLPSEIEKKEAVPYIISFSRTSFPAAKNFGTIMTKLAMKNLPPPCAVLELSIERQTKEDNTYMVMCLKQKREGTPEEINEAFKWVQPISQGTVKITEDPEELDTQESGASVGDVLKDDDINF